MSEKAPSKPRYCDNRYCPFCQPWSRRKGAKLFCFRWDFRPMCWLKRMLAVTTLIRQYGGKDFWRKFK